MIGRIVEGKYSVLREIGSGTIFTVYLAVNQISNEVVALKVLRDALAGNGQFLARLRREATLLEELDSPYVARILDYGDDQGRIFVVQEYIPGRSLDQILKEDGPLDVERALGIIQQVAQCVADSSGVGLIHRDLRPENIVLTSGFSAKVLDYGVAVALDLVRLRLSGAVGLPLYVAPELAMGSSGDVRADVYSLGVVLFELLTGRTPFLGEEASAVILGHLQAPAPSVQSVNSDISPAVDRLVARCLAKEPQERYLPLDLVRAIADLLGEVEVGPGVEGALAGHTLGRYQLLERVGRGGMAAVYKAYQSGLDRYVAIKVLPVYLAHDPRFLGRFRREARAIAQLNHPNILPVHDFGREGDLTYIVMKYVEGGTLKDLLGQPLPLARTVEIVSQVAAALDHAHGQGIVHRDVKPGNVLMADTHWPLLSDFGLARIVGTSVQYSSTGASIGTPDYISPEQAMGQAADARSDVYSLGVMVYEMSTGRVPFEAGTPMGVVIKHITAEPPPPTQYNPELSWAVEDVIVKALAKEPRDRYQSAGELASALEAASAVKPGEEKAPPEAAQVDAAAAPRPPTGRRAPGAGRAVWMVAAAVLVLLIAIGLATQMWSGAIPIMPDVQQQIAGQAPSDQPQGISPTETAQLRGIAPLATATSTVIDTAGSTSTVPAIDSATATRWASPSPSATTMSSATATHTATATNTPSPTSSATVAQTATATNTATPTATSTSARRPPPTATLRPTPNPSPTSPAPASDNAVSDLYSAPTWSIRGTASPPVTDVSVSRGPGRMPWAPTSALNWS